MQHPNPNMPEANNVPSSMAGTQLQPWRTGLCSCCDDCNSCCLTLWCPCIAFGRIAHVQDRGDTSCCGSGTLCCFLCLCVGFQWIYTCMYRRKIRVQYNLQESPCCDCCIDYFCECCSLCQMYRELELRNSGLSLSLGYYQNKQSWGQGKMQPPQGPTMTR